MGFGVAISLLFAILVLALANSNRSVWGFSGSKQIPFKAFFAASAPEQLLEVTKPTGYLDVSLISDPS